MFANEKVLTHTLAEKIQQLVLDDIQTEHEEKSKVNEFFGFSGILGLNKMLRQIQLQMFFLNISVQIRKKQAA